MKVTIHEMPKGGGEAVQIVELTEESPTFRPGNKRDLFKIEVSDEHIMVFVSPRK